MEASPHHLWARDDLLANPLTATLCLAIIRLGNSLPSSRSELFIEITERLFQDWSESRNNDPIEWCQIAPSIERIALKHIQSRQPYVTRNEFKRELRSISPHRVRKLEFATERCFGVLVQFDGGHGYEFLFRGLAEHLAGAALLQPKNKRYVENISDTASQPWAEEVVRHAIGIAMARKEDEAGLNMMRQLIKAGQPQPDSAQQWLRSLLVAIRTAADIQSYLTQSDKKELLTNILYCLLEEESHWVGDRVADAVEVIAAAGGTLAYALWRYYSQHALIKYEPAAWYQAQADRPASWWLAALQHRDAYVRIIACERLGDHINCHQVREALELMLEDESGYGFPVALRAGAVLRQAKRNRHFKQIRESLLELLEEGGQYSAGGAALALRPGEAHPMMLAHALANAYRGTREMLAAPVHELAAAPGGQQALDAEWPQWRDGLVERWQRLDKMFKTMPGDQIPEIRPMSRRVRRRMKKALMPGFRHFPAEEIEKAYAASIEYGTKDNIEELCRGLYYQPTVFLPYLRLNEFGGTVMSPEAQHDLGRAATKHDLVRKELLGAWEQDPKFQNTIGAYPGVALEPLVLRDDEKAVSIYSQWLKLAPYTWSSDFPRPDPNLFTIEEIKTAALRCSRGAWEFASQGRTVNNKVQWLAPQSVKTVLHYFCPAWLDNSKLVAEISQWIDDEDEKSIAAIWAFAGGSPNEQVRISIEEAITRHVQRYTDLKNTINIEHAAECLRVIEILSLEKLTPLLEEVATGSKSSLNALATALLLPSLREAKARSLVAGIAADGVLPSRRFLGAGKLRALVQAAPNAWLDLINREIKEGGSLDFTMCLRILPYLTDEEQRAQLAREVYRCVGHDWIPWQEMGDGRDRLSRPIDLVSRILFEAGIRT